MIARIRWAQKKCSVELGTGVFAEIEKWDSVKQCSKTNTTHKVGSHVSTARMVNSRIVELRNCAEEVFARYEVKGEYPGVNEFKEEMSKKLHPEQEIKAGKLQVRTLDDLQSAYFSEFECTWKPRTKYRYAQAVTHAKAFKEKTMLDEIDKSYIQGLVIWHIENGYHNETTNSRLDALKTMLRWGAQNGYNIKPEAYETRTEIPSPLKKVVFLKFNELMDFYHFPFAEGSTLAKYRDMWCFMAFTSLRYSDMQGLKKANVSDDDFIEIYTEKTSEYLKIPLIAEAKDIIHRYSRVEGEYVFPRISDQKMNKYIKIAAEQAGLSREVIETYYIGKERIEETLQLCKTLSCHDARRTFVCCSLKLGIPAPIVMKMTGHEDYDSMKPYIEVADETTKVEMTKWTTNPIKLEIINLLETATMEQLENARKALSHRS